MKETKLDKAIGRAIADENKRHEQGLGCPHCGKPDCIPALCPEFLKGD